MNPSYNEREVLALLQEESTQKRGFEMIVAQYSEQLYWQIRRMVLSHEDANDLLQNTFVKAWLNIDYFRAEAKLSTWLYRIALNECLTFLNKQRAASTVSLDAPEADTLQKLESDPYFSGDKAQMALQKALLTLPEKQRMVFNLKYYQEMKYEQMSDIFGTSVGALKASYHHAVKKIEKILKKVGTENAFHVPEGYFENFTSELMNRLPEKEKLAFEQKEPTMWERVKPWAYMAAMFVGAALIIRVASSDRTPAATDRMAADETETEMEYINMAVDNSMLDDYSLYVYLADSDAE